MKKQMFSFLSQLAKGLAAQFGENCEIVVHDLSGKSTASSIVIIENGHVSNRKIGDGPSHVVLETLRGDRSRLTDHLNYLTRTQEGKLLKSSTLYVRDEDGDAIAIVSINYDITHLLMAENILHTMTAVEKGAGEPERIHTNVNALLDELIEQSVRLVGKPVALMNKEDKIKAIKFLSDTGAFLITKSGDKVSKFYQISKYTLYSYIDSKES